MTHATGASSVSSADVTLLHLIDRLGLAKYAGVFIEQEVVGFMFILCMRCGIDRNRRLLLSALAPFYLPKTLASLTCINIQ